MILEVLMSISLVWFLSWLFNTFQERRDGIPGPLPLPIIGNMLQLGSNPPFTMDHLWQKYENVYKIASPMGNFIVLNGAEAILEALKIRKDDFSGRPVDLMYPLDIIFDSSRDIVTSDFDSKYVFRRKLFMSAMHVYGEGARLAEERSNRIVNELLVQAEAQEGKAFDLTDCVGKLITIHLWEWISSKHCQLEDRTVESLLQLAKNVMLLGKQANIYQLFPFLGYFPTKFMKRVDETVKIRNELFQPEFDEHLKTFSEDVPRDLTDAMISAFKKEKSKNCAKDLGTIDDIKFLMANVIKGGVDTSTTLVAWSVLYILLEQDLQTKLQKEIDEVGGRDRLPCRNDFKHLHNLQATVCEVIRHSDLLPWVIRKTKRDTLVQGYEIKKDTTVFINYHRLSKDPKEWEEPAAFRPQRFLDENEQFVGWNGTDFLPFGLGRRSCPGKELGKMLVLAILTGLLHQYTFTLPDEEPKPTLMDAEFSIVRWPKSYKVILIKR